MPLISHKKLSLFLISISSALLGLSILLMGHHSHIKLITDFYGITDKASADTFNYVAGFSFVLLALMSLLATFYERHQRSTAALLTIISLVPLLALASDAMWIGDLGGFPAIGSGQGVIKYFALLSLALLLLSENKLSATMKQWISALPIILVLLWIGGMKFTLLEAKGIEPLVASSPLMSWMYSLWDLQLTSNLIGIYDLIAMLMILLAIYRSAFLLPAIMLSGAVFVVTQSFLFTWDAALSEETLLTTGGHFLIKDLWYIACLAYFWQASVTKRKTSESG